MDIVETSSALKSEKNYRVLCTTLYMSIDRIGIIGCGFVGTHLIDVFSEQFGVHGYDISESRIEVLREQFKNKENVSFYTCFDTLKECTLICICVPTPVNNNVLNDTYLRAAVQTLHEYLDHEKPTTIVMESSVSVGLTRTLLRSLHEKGHYVCMSPERVDPGRIHPHARDIPKIVSGIDEDSLQSISRIYSQAFTTIVPVSSLELGELCKLYENTFRVINISFANQISDSCQQLGIDANEMFRASATKPYGFMPFHSCLYIGGSCLPNNSRVLLNSCELPLLKAATEFNEQRPFNKASELIEKYPNAKTFLVVGLGFKAGQDITEHSPGLKIAEILQNRFMKKVNVLDPLVKQGQFESADLKTWRFDLVVVAIKQINIDYSSLLEKCKTHDTPIVSFDMNFKP